MIGFISGVLGLLASRILFFKFPGLTSDSAASGAAEVSVIIPARNEALTLPLLLSDLMQQTAKPMEIICVDDDSTDGTAKVASLYGAKVVSAPPRPQGWLGKPWACETGAKASEGKHLLFLDADVRLSHDALAALMSDYGQGKKVISVQPYHAVPGGYEQFSLIFNIVLWGANGASLFKAKPIGLFGPVILMHKTSFDAIHGFSGACCCIAEDVKLGICLKEANIKTELFCGKDLISFRMYSDGFDSLLNGWTKNFASGAVSITVFLKILVVLWVMGCVSAPFYLILRAINGTPIQTGIQAVLYILWVSELRRVACKLGSFNWAVILFYPLSLLLFFGVFIRSFLKKILKRSVRWKDRDIRLGE